MQEKDYQDYQELMSDINVWKKIDAYIKRVLVNTLNDKRREEERKNRYGISFLEMKDYSISQFLSELNENEFFDIEKKRIDIDCYDIYLLNTELADVINTLSERKRLTLVLNVVIELPINEIAEKIGVSDRMARKYKKAAIDEIKYKMPDYIKENME